MVKEPRCRPSLASAENPVAVWRWDDGMSVTGSKWPSDALAKIRGSWRDSSWQLPRCFVTTGTNYRDNCHETEEDGLWCVAFHSSIVPPYNLAKVRKMQRPHPVAGAVHATIPLCFVSQRRKERKGHIQLQGRVHATIPICFVSQRRKERKGHIQLQGPCLVPALRR